MVSTDDVAFYGSKHIQRRTGTQASPPEHCAVATISVTSSVSGSNVGLTGVNRASLHLLHNETSFLLFGHPGCGVGGRGDQKIQTHQELPELLAHA